ncbi:hypothetical protein ACS0TY_000688 [Phlomoides rotata]
MLIIRGMSGRSFGLSEFLQGLNTGFGEYVEIFCLRKCDSGKSIFLLILCVSCVCEIVLSCWELSGFKEKLECLVIHVDSLSELFLRVFSELDKESANSFLMVGWRMWKIRNDVVWEGKSSTTYRVVCDATVSLQEWLSARYFRSPAGQGRAPAVFGSSTATSGGMAAAPGRASAATRGSPSAAGGPAAAPGRTTAATGGKAVVQGSITAATGGTSAAAGRSTAMAGGRAAAQGRIPTASVGWSATGSSSTACPRWHFPGVGVVKFNVDAAVFAESQQIGLGMVACDDSGPFVVGRIMVFTGLFRVDEAEIMGGFRGPFMGKGPGFLDIEMEMDAKKRKRCYPQEDKVRLALSLVIYSNIVFFRMFLVLPILWHILLLGPRDLFRVSILGSSLLPLWMAFSGMFVLVANN